MLIVHIGINTGVVDNVEEPKATLLVEVECAGVGVVYGQLDRGVAHAAQTGSGRLQQTAGGGANEGQSFVREAP